jgi:hypothetical protein
MFDSMATLEKNSKRKHRFRRRYLDWLYLASALICLLVSLPTGMALGQEVQPEAHHEARAWLEFNHHLGGMVVLVLASLTWLEILEIRPIEVIRLCWPSCLILIGLYNVILSDKFAWPIGPSGLVDSLSNPEVLQHKVLAVSVLTLGLIELLRRLELMTHIAWLYLFYGLAILPGAILLVHDFSAAHHAHAHSLTVSHVLMGLLALLALVLKVLVDHRLIIGRWAHLYPLVLTGLGVQLLLFTESSEVVR